MPGRDPPHVQSPGFGLHFEVLSQIAVGSTARVDLCRSTGPRDQGQLIAVKRLLPELLHDDALAKRFLDEVWMTAALRHPNVVGVVGWGHDREGPYLAVDLVQGVSLARLSKSVFETGEQFPERLVVYIGLCVARGLSAAHELRSERGEHLQLVHRDLTAGNVLLGFAGEVRIADFGLAKAKDRLTVTTSELPKRGIGHVAPEELEQRAVDHRSDFFGLGVLLYEALTGKAPFRGKDDVDVLQAVLRKTPADPAVVRPKADRSLSQLILACLEKQPEARPPSARAIAASLEEWLYNRGYLQDSPEALGRFVRRNSMRQMRWFERAIAGEPEPVPGHVPPPAGQYPGELRPARGPLASMTSSSNEPTVVDGRKAPPPPRRTRAATDGSQRARRRDSSPGMDLSTSDGEVITRQAFGVGVPSMVEEEGEDDPTLALKLDPEMAKQMREHFQATRGRNASAAEPETALAKGADSTPPAPPVAPAAASGPPPLPLAIPHGLPFPRPIPREPLATVRIEDVETADSATGNLQVVQAMQVAARAEAAARIESAAGAAAANAPSTNPERGQRSKKSLPNILEHIENELALLRALARERHEAARVARAEAHAAAVRADEAEADARAVERAMAGARQAMDLASRGDPLGATKKLEEAFSDVARPRPPKPPTP